MEKSSSKGKAPSEREQTRAEDIANSLCHGVGLVAALVAIPFLLSDAARLGSLALVVGCGVFAVTIVLVYLSSTLYHGLPAGRWKESCRVFDHYSILLLIAGTYTPLTLGVLYGPWGWLLFGLIWGLAAIGVVLINKGGIHHPWLMTVLYLLMGWLIVIVPHPFLPSIPEAAVSWLIAGGLAYTVGVLFFNADHIPFAHLLWHVFVILGTGSHFAMVWVCIV